MGMYGERHNMDLTGAKFEITKEMVKEPVRRVGELKLKVILPASKVPADMRPTLEGVGHSCPVHKSLHPDIKADIEFVYV